MNAINKNKNNNKTDREWVNNKFGTIKYINYPPPVGRK